MKARSARYRLDDLLIDTGTRRVTREGADLGITGLSFDLLLALGHAAPNLLSMDALVETVWPRQVVSAETITQRVKLLRQRLGDDAERPRYISSRRAHGYCLMSAMSALPTQSPTHDVEANELYLQARTVMRGTHESRDQAILLLDQALERDPQFAQALAFRAVLQAGAVTLSGASPTHLESAWKDAAQALARDPDLPDAHVARAFVCAHRQQWIESDTHFRAALSLEPSDPFVRNLHVLNVLRPTGRLRQAHAELSESYRLAPAQGFTAHELALTHSVSGNDAEALRFAALTQALSGIGTPHWDLLLVYARAAARDGRYEEAAERATNGLPSILRDEGGGEVLHNFYSSLTDASRKPMAREALQAFAPRLQLIGVFGRTRSFFLTAFAMLGDLDGAFDVANQGALDWSDLWLPEMRAFRADPRFSELVRRLGMVEYWKRSGPPDDFAGYDSRIS